MLPRGVHSRVRAPIAVQRLMSQSSAVQPF